MYVCMYMYMIMYMYTFLCAGVRGASVCTVSVCISGHRYRHTL